MKKLRCGAQPEARPGISLRLCALAVFLVLVLAILPGCDRKKSIHIATKPMTEQYILGEMLKLLIEQDTGTTVRITQGVGGGTSNIHPAMVKGAFDLYPVQIAALFHAPAQACSPDTLPLRDCRLCSGTWMQTRRIVEHLLL